MVKKFVGVFAKRVAQSAMPSSCQSCECFADNHGISKMSCSPCSSFKIAPQTDFVSAKFYFSFIYRTKRFAGFDY